MPRGLSAAAKTYVGPVLWTADITALDGTAYYFWTGAENQAIGGNTYLPYLRIPRGFQRSRGLAVDSGELELINADLYIAGILDTKVFASGLCIVKQFLFSIEESVEIFRGRLSEQEQRQDAIAYRLVSEFEPSQIDALQLSYSALCQWRFAKPPCGYLRDSITVTENLAEQTADIFSTNTIGKAALAEGVDAHVDRFVLITSGTGKGQHRRIKSNSATTVTLYQTWKTTPDGTSKFRIVTAPNGLPKQLLTATTALDIATADIFTARTIGRSTLAMTVDEHKSTGADDVAAVVRIIAGTGSGQEKKIKSNTATTITIADAETAFSPVPDGTSTFRVLYLHCPKDILESCEQRGRTHRFNGAPTISPELSRIYSDPNPTGGMGGGGGRYGEFQIL